MSLTLLGATASPYVRKIRVLLHETGQEDVVFTPVQSSPLGGEAALNAANPLGKIPALRREGGPTLYDSRVIARFLDARAGAGLYPETRLWDTLTLEALGDGMADAAVGIIYEKRHRPEEMWFAPWLDGQWAKVDRALDALERQWLSHLHGPLDMGQVAVACVLGYLDLRHDDKGWRDGRPGLAAWQMRFAERPSMAATAPE